MEEKYNAWQCPLNARTHLYHSEGVIAWVLGSCFLLPIPSADPQLVDSRPPISVNLFKPQTVQDMSCGWGGVTISKSGSRSTSISLHRCISLQLDSNTLLHLRLQKKHLMDEQRPHPVGSSLLGSWRPQVNQAPGQPWSGSRFQVNLDQVPGSRSILIRWADQGGFTAWHWVLFAGRWAAAYDGNQSRPQSPQPAQPHIPAPAIQGKGLSWPGQASNEQTIQMEYFLPFSLLLFLNQAS